MKTKKLLTGLLSTVLTLTLCQGFVATFANTDSTEPTPADPTEAIISKTIQMDENTTTPASTFTFNVTKVSVDEKTEGADFEAMPVIANQTISFAEDDNTGKVVDPETKVKTVTKATENIIPAADTFPHAGHYIYTIFETEGIVTDMTYSDKQYQLDVLVYNTDNGLAIGGVTVSTNEDGKSIVEPDEGKAVLSFLNTYAKNWSSDDPDAKSLVVSNTVTGNLGDKTKDFNYTLTITSVPPFAGNGPFDAVLSYQDEPVQVALNTPYTFTLKHGETLSFDSLPVGAKVTVTQTKDSEYETSVITTSKGEPVEGTYEANITISETTNTIAYTNNKDTSTVPTGIISNNLPFFGLIVLALGGFVCLVALRRKYNS